jgi:hypothetical protein
MVRLRLEAGYSGSRLTFLAYICKDEKVRRKPVL